MKTRLIARLDLLAEISETVWLREIARHSRTLEQAAEQRALLGAYRDKLGRGWRGGGVVDAATAKRAADFTAASRSAESQIDEMERRAAQQLDRARIAFAETQDRRRNLLTASRSAVATGERTTTQRLERAQRPPAPKPWRSA